MGAETTQANSGAESAAVKENKFETNELKVLAINQ